MERNSFRFSYTSLQAILIVALVFRLLAAFFSKGYAFHDDHFCVVRVAQNWAYGLPHWIESPTPPKHSMLYAAVNASLIWLSDQAGMHDPIAKTTLLRLVHAFFSLLIIYYAYKITRLLSSAKDAALVGWILSLLWFMPYLGVKFLAEMTCTVPVLAGFYFMLQKERAGKGNNGTLFICGLLFGLAFTIRMHTILFAGGLGLVLLFEKRIKDSILFTLGYLLVVAVVIGIPDYLFFEYPFQYIVGYFTHNVDNAYNYITGSPFKFLLTTFGFLVPPVSLMLIWGYIRSWKVEPKMFLAVLVFFIAHSAFPNKQERFILPMYPLLVILGTIGWNQFIARSSFWQKYPRLESGGWKFFWAANVLAAFALAVTFTKKDRVEPIYHLSAKQDVRSVIVESSSRSVKQVPVYYLGRKAADYSDFEKGNILGMNHWKSNKKYLDEDIPFIFSIGAGKNVDDLEKEMLEVGKKPNYIIFKGTENLEPRQDRLQPLFPGQEFVLERTIEPSVFDILLHKLNPKKHRDETAFIYKVVGQGVKPSVSNP